MVLECIKLSLGSDGISLESLRYLQYSNALLLILLFLQVYWFYLIVDVAVRQIRGGNAADNRSDGSGVESDNEEELRSPQDPKKNN